jgi:hypothetical protein
MIRLWPYQGGQGNQSSGLHHCWFHYIPQSASSESTSINQESMNLVFIDESKEVVFYPINLKDITQTHLHMVTLKKLEKNHKKSTQLVKPLSEFARMAR